MIDSVHFLAWSNAPMSPPFSTSYDDNLFNLCAQSTIALNMNIKKEMISLNKKKVEERKVGAASSMSSHQREIKGLSCSLTSS